MFHPIVYKNIFARLTNMNKIINVKSQDIYLGLEYFSLLLFQK